MTHVPTLGKFYVTLRANSVREMDDFFYKTVIYLDSVSYVFPARPSWIFSWEIHAGGLAGHFGQNKTIEAVKHHFYWPSLKKDVAKIVGQCRICQLAKQ